MVGSIGVRISGIEISTTVVIIFTTVAFKVTIITVLIPISDEQVRVQANPSHAAASTAASAAASAAALDLAAAAATAATIG
jgi:hypothetical protein